MHYNKAVCLVLDKRYDDWISFKQQCDQFNIKVEPFIAGDGNNKNIKYDHIDTNILPRSFVGSTTYATWYRRPNAYNAWQCHYQIIKQAITNNIKKLFLLEDDSYIENDFQEILDKSKDFLNSDLWDMLYLGWYSKGNLINIDKEHIYRMNGGGGFHGVIMNQLVMKRLLSRGPLGPMDWMAGQYIHNEFDCYAVYPAIITQKSGYSYVEGGNLDKPKRTEK